MLMNPRLKKISDIAVEMQEVSEKLLNELTAMGCGPDSRDPEEEMHIEPGDSETPDYSEMKSSSYNKDKERKKAALIIRMRKSL